MSAAFEAESAVLFRMTDSTGFATFGTPHLVALVLTLALPATLAVLARRLGGGVPTVIARLLAGVLLANEFTYWAIRISQIGLDGWVRNHLPLHVCGAAVLLIAWTLLFRSEKTFEIVYFWGLVGAANAVLTPGNLDVDFPQYRFFQYFIAHSGIVTGVLFATWGLGMRPTLRGMLRAFGYLAAFAGFVAGANLLLGSNFMWLSGPPPGTASPFFAAPWPWYLPILAAAGLTMFFVVLSPFLVSDWWRKRVSGT